jgi:hypothetical protein
MKLPESLFHYYEGNRQPFLSISELEPSKFKELMDELSHLDTTENRFDEKWKRDFYLFFRPYTEQIIRDRFIEKGGKPQLDVPRYATLGPATWFNNWYEDPQAIEIPLADFPSESISFTYPDSMMSLLIAEDRYEPFAKFKQPYHGEVYRLEELLGLVAEYGLPDESDPENIEYGNRIIEAQIWDLSALKPYLG